MGLPWEMLIGWHAAVALVAAWLNTLDKRRARRGGRRVPERTLHLVDLLGGWIGGVPVRRLIRHKTAKSRFGVVTSLAVGGHLSACALAWWALRA